MRPEQPRTEASRTIYAAPRSSWTLLRAGHNVLPDELLQLIPERLRRFALLWAGIFLVGAPVDILAGATDYARPGGVLFGMIVGAVVVVASLAVVYLTRRNRVSAEALAHVGLFYEILCAASLALVELLIRPVGPETTHGLSFVMLLVVTYPVIVPSATAHTLFSSLVSGAMPLLAILWFRSLGMADPEPYVLLELSVQGFFGAAIAVVAARMVFHLGRRAQEARELGSYHLERKLGAGGMGEVWLGRHRLLARPAAIKLIRSDRLDTMETVSRHRVIERFRREAEATAQLLSPHTVALFDFGVTDDRVFYYVMELIDGVDLERLVQERGPMPSERVVHLLVQACHSLAEAHEQDLVHRDIKPANLIVSPRRAGDVDFLQVLDFGLVALRGEQHERSSPRLTADGAIQGTPAYLAPETINEGRADPRSDIYALGCVAFWLLTGRAVFEGKGAVSVIVAHVNQPPPRASELAELEVPPALDDLVLACLDKDPDKRPQTAPELARRLVECSPDVAWTPDRARHWWETSRPRTVAQP